jgi:nucleoside-triphosphatase
VANRDGGKRHILITGLPGSGKTSLVIGLVDKIAGVKCGFVTEEVRDERGRTGFEIVTIPFGANSVRIPLAVKETTEIFKGAKGTKGALKGLPRVGSYRVFVENVDRAAVDSIAEGCDFTIIDEIGKMECLSEKFRDAVLRSFDLGKRVVATVPKRGVPFAEEIKRRKDVQLFEITRDNRDSLLDEILDEILKGGEPVDYRPPNL